VGALEVPGAGGVAVPAGSVGAWFDPEAAAGVLLQLTGMTLFLWCTGRLVVVGWVLPEGFFAGVVAAGGAGAGGFCVGGFCVGGVVP
jgi:hypothetical protein